MKVLLLAEPNSSHTIKWARSLAESGLQIHIFGLSKCEQPIYRDYPNIRVHTFGLEGSIVKAKLGSLSKLRYLKALGHITQIIREYRPDIVHSHFASSYGLIGALTGFHPYVLSVWGADIFDFPRKSFLHRALIKYNLSKADKVLSTSQVMAKEASKYTDKQIEVTPFGIDLNVFRPLKVRTIFDESDIVIGTVKALEKKYGIEYLIRAFKIIKDRHPALPLRLLIIGGGSQENYLKDLARELDIQDRTTFMGSVSYDQVRSYHNMLSIFVSLSVLDSESFGVAVIEASACEKPVVVSNVGGLPEVVEGGKTGFVVPSANLQEAAKAIEKLILDEDLRIKMGKAGRERVNKLYNWDDCVRQMISIYDRMITARLG